MKAKRRLLFQILAVVLLVAIGYTMTIIGRGHTIYLDSKTLEYDGQTYKPAYKTVVYVDGQQVAKLYDKERWRSPSRRAERKRFMPIISLFPGRWTM